jgi:two-component system NarL family sensor kinase
VTGPTGPTGGAGGAGRWQVPAAGVVAAAFAGAGLAVPDAPVARTTALLWLLFGAACLACGEWLRQARRPQPAVGVLLSVAGALLLLAAAGAAWLPVGVTARLAVVGALAAFPLAVVVFPARPVPRVVGPVVIGTVLGLTAVILVRPTDPDVVSSLGLIVVLAVVTVVWWRFEGAAEADRRQLLWLILAAGLTLVVGGQLFFLLENPVPAMLVGLSVPVALVIGVLRPDAADVRLLTVRGVVLGVVVLLYVALFSGIIGLLRVATGGTPTIGALAVIGAVLAAAFQPTRTVLQGVVDELLFGNRANPEQAMSDVSERLSDDPVLALRALRQSLVLPYAALVADGAVIASSGTPLTPTRSRPLRVGRDAIGELVVGLRSGDLRLRASDETVLGIVAPALAHALQARLLTEELRRSRGEVISGVEEERRRLRRDLHDGLGPTLTGVAYTADAARNLLGSDPAAADALLADLRAATAQAIGEIRRLVEGLRPPMLDDLGLTQAIRQGARQLRSADGRALVVTVHAPDPLPDVPAAVEVVAYRIVVEALTNVCRHAASDRAEVTLRLADEWLELEVLDGGTAAGRWRPHAGIVSMRERAERVGGSCVAEPSPTGGRVTARLPCLGASGGERR